MNSRRFRASVVLTVVLCVITGTTRCLAGGIEVKSATDVDERLFLTYVLHELYEDFPRDSNDPKALQQQLQELRLRANRFHEYVKSRDFDPILTGLYADLLTALNDYTTFLTTIGRIERDVAVRAEREQVDTSTRTGVAFGAAAAGSYNNGASGGEAAMVGLAAAALTHLWDSSNKNQDRTEDRRRACEEAANQFDTKLSSINARLQNAETDLAAKYHWKQAEMRSAMPAGEDQRFAELAKAHDQAGVVQLMDRNVERRPRDPMLLAVREYIANRPPVNPADQRTPAQMVDAAKRCIGATSLIPQGRVYDVFRARILWTASSLAEDAYTVQLLGKAIGAVKDPIAAWAVEVWDAALIYVDGDPTGECGEGRAWALLASGNPNEALRQANAVLEARKSSLSFAYNYVRLMCALDNTDKAFEWFDSCIRILHFVDIRYAQNDPSLQPMRQAKAAEFKTLTAVTYVWSIDFGMFNDDVLVKNTSAFPITNVIFSCNVKGGGKSFAPELKATLIKPGEIYRWSKAFSIPGSKADVAEGQLSCDQGVGNLK